MALKNMLKMISNDDMDAIHAASKKILAETGVVFHNDEALGAFKAHGAKVDGQTACIPPSMVKDALGTVPSSFKWQARNPDRSVQVGDDTEKLLVQPNFGPIHIRDLQGKRREATLADFADMVKICQASEVVSLVGASPLEPADVPQEHKHLYMMHETLKHSDKPVIGMQLNGFKVKQLLEMVEIAMGRKGYLQEHHCITVGLSSFSPLHYERTGSETLIQLVANNQPLFLTSAIMLGFSGPISLMGTVILQNTEILAGIVLAQLIRPGTPVVYSIGSCPANMRNGNFVTGSPEMAMIHVAGMQMAREYYGIPVRSMTGMTDAKTIDAQAGYETMQSLLVSALGGAHIVFECLGALDALMTTSYAKLMIDLELVERVMRIRDGLDTSQIGAATQTIQDVAHSGEYIMHNDTLNHCRRQWFPSLSDWDSRENWEANGAEDVARSAQRKCQEMLEEAPESLIDPEADRALQAYIRTAV